MSNYNKTQGVNGVGKHKLDEVTEDILQHYGIKGMSWGVRRSEEELAAARDDESAGGGGGEGEEGMFDEMGDMFDNIMEDLDNIGDDIKKKGMSILTGIFGKSEVKYSIAKPNKEMTDRLRKQLKDGPTKEKSFLDKLFPTTTTRIVPKFNAKATKELREAAAKDVRLNPKAQVGNRMAAKANAELKGMSKTEQRNAKKPVRRTYTTTEGPASTTNTVRTTRKGFLGIPVTSERSTTSYNTSPQPKKKKKKD